MKLPSKVSQWFRAIPTVKFLFLLALFLFANTFFNQQYLLQLSSNSQNNQHSQLIAFIIASGKHQILPLVKSDKLEDIEVIMQQQLEHPVVYQVALYKADGSLLNSLTKPNPASSKLLNKVSHLTQDNQNFGYLVYQFQSMTNNTTQNYYWLYSIASGLWFLGCLLMWLSRESKAKTLVSAANHKKEFSYKKELQQLLKRSQAQLNSDSDNLLIIHTDWDAHAKDKRKPLLSLLNRWTMHNHSHLVSFDNDLLVLGLQKELNLDTFKKIQILEICFKQLGINPTLLVHDQQFGKAIYQHFFGIVENGVWLESNQQIKSIAEDTISIQEDIEIEVESFGIIHLSKLKPLKAEDATAIERQARFFLN
ncbi:MAG: hypothetical protein HWE16_05245 [Gammaproteobacteria bacterium]|nr:hypothetical protein [Gammaproteobacteria bacterium]